MICVIARERESIPAFIKVIRFIHWNAVIHCRYRFESVQRKRAWKPSTEQFKGFCFSFLRVFFFFSKKRLKSLIKIKVPLNFGRISR